MCVFFVLFCFSNWLLLLLLLLFSASQRFVPSQDGSHTPCRDHLRVHPHVQADVTWGRTVDTCCMVHWLGVTHSSTVVAWADLVAGSFWPLYGAVSSSCWLTDVGPASRQTVRRSCDVNRPCGLCLPTVLSLHLVLPALRIECDASF